MLSILLRSVRKLRVAAAISAGLVTCVASPTEAWADAAKPQPASMRLATPGEQHRWLEPLVGRWQVEMRVFTEAESPLIVAKQRSARRDWARGSRDLIEDLADAVAGERARRRALPNYSNLDERWELTPIDTFEPSPIWYAGHVRGTPRRFERSGESTEAGFSVDSSGRKRTLRFEFEILDPDRNLQRIYVEDPAQPEVLFVEQIFSPQN